MEYTRQVIMEDYKEQIQQAISELQQMEDSDVKMYGSMILDVLDYHIKAIVGFKAEIRQYMEHRNYDRELLDYIDSVVKRIYQ